MSYDESVDAWIDMYHSIRRLARQDTLIFLTDNAVGQAEEENLAHLTANLAGELEPARIVPFLTAKHSHRVHPALRRAGRVARLRGAHRRRRRSCPPARPAAFPHAYQLRQWIRRRVPSLDLGGWVNPLRIRSSRWTSCSTPSSRRSSISPRSSPTIPSAQSSAFWRRLGAAEYPIRACSASSSIGAPTRARCEQLGDFLPVPAEGITRDFEAGSIRGGDLRPQHPGAAGDRA